MFMIEIAGVKVIHSYMNNQQDSIIAVIGIILTSAS